MADTRLKSIVIVGGGTAGWMTAAALAKRLDTQYTRILLVESAEIGTIGVGEATVPFIKEFLQRLQISEPEFMKATHATYKLGISFEDWKKPGHRFMHPFAGYGARIDRIPFYHFWTKLRQQQRAEPLDNYSLATQMAWANKFALPNPNSDNELTAFNYAFHFDAGLFANYLANYAQALGVRSINARIEQVMQHSDTGFITGLVLQNGEQITGDFFIDCSGFKGLLIEQTLHTGYEDWSHWLICDSAIALASAEHENPPPYTRSLATSAGWQWRIPLQHRTGNGYVYSSRFISDEHAEQELRQQLQGAPLGPARQLRFTTGMRKHSWNKNVFAIGLASGFLEPLESTSIYMIQESINLLLDYLPNRHCSPYLAQTVNQQLRHRQEKLRDFLILHYALNNRQGDAFWDYCRAIPLPDSLTTTMNNFHHTGQLALDSSDFFRTNSWLAMFAGFDRLPIYYHPCVDQFDEQLVKRELDNIAQKISTALPGITDHQQFMMHNNLFAQPD